MQGLGGVLGVCAYTGRVCVGCDGTYMGRLGLGRRLISFAAMLRVKPRTPLRVLDLTTMPADHSALSWFGRRNLDWSSAGSTWLMYRSYWEKLGLLDRLLAADPSVWAVAVVGVATAAA